MSSVTQARTKRMPSGSVSARCAKLNGKLISSHSEQTDNNRLVPIHTGAPVALPLSDSRMAGAVKPSRLG